MRLAGNHCSPLSISPFSLCSKGSFVFSCQSIHISRSRLVCPSSHGFFSVIRHHPPLVRVTYLSRNAFSKSDNAQPGPFSEKDFLDENGSSRRGSFSSKEILEKLKKYGISGVLSYGLLNTVYYSIAFLLVWFYVAPAPGRMGYVAAVERFLKVMAMVWAGSQVTKLIRAGGALALAPFVDRGLSWFTVKFKFESQGKAFMAIVGMCLGLAVTLFLVVTLLSA